MWFSAEVASRKFKFTACGLFQINYELLFTVKKSINTRISLNLNFFTGRWFICHKYGNSRPGSSCGSSTASGKLAAKLVRHYLNVKY